MTEKHHPVIPSPELRAQWRQEAPRYRDGGVTREDWLINSAAQWGLSQCSRLPVPAHFLGVPLIPPADCMDSQSWIAMRIYQMGCDQRGKDIERERQEAADQELEACCALMDEWGLCGEDLMQCRRPKPPSLKEQSLKHLDVMERDAYYLPEILQDLRRAVEALPE